MKPPKRIHKLLPVASFAGLLLLANLHLVLKIPADTLIFRQEQVAAGQWWRLVTHPLVHVSWYHLALDGLAMVILWRELKLETLGQKITAVVPCLLMSLCWAILFSPHLAKVGYCGLSGIAHGLMFLLGLQWLSRGWRHRQERVYSAKTVLAGALLALAVAAKSVVEVVQGESSLVQYHLADLGIPIVHAHLGGVIGGALACLALCLPAVFSATTRPNSENGDPRC